MEFKDYYSILGVTPEDDKQSIKKAYRRLARKYHPDVSTEHNAEHNFKEVSEAYEVLGDDDKRAEYDQIRQFESHGNSFTPPPGWKPKSGAEGQYHETDFSDFFATLFGDNGRSKNTRGFSPFENTEDFYSTRGQDIEMEMPVFLEDTLRENTKTIQYSLPKYGPTGQVGSVEKTLKVKIPMGVGDGERIRLKSQGGPGFGDGGAGDLYLRIRLIPHPLFDVTGRDLNITVPLAPWEAALGTKVTIPTLDGKITVNVNPESQTGAKLRIKEKGLPDKAKRGDLYVILKVVMPDEENSETKKLWAQLSEKSGFCPRKNFGK